MQQWIKIPQPGQFRGEGIWVKVDQSNDKLVDYYEYCKATGYLPVAEQDEEPET